MISGRMGLLEREIEYFEELLNYQNICESRFRQLKTTDKCCHHQSWKKQSVQFISLESHKSQGADEIVTEFVIYAGDELHKEFIN